MLSLLPHFSGVFNAAAIVFPVLTLYQVLPEIIKATKYCCCSALTIEEADVTVRANKLNLAAVLVPDPGNDTLCGSSIFRFLTEVVMFFWPILICLTSQAFSVFQNRWYMAITAVYLWWLACYKLTFQRRKVLLPRDPLVDPNLTYRAETTFSLIVYLLYAASAVAQSIRYLIEESKETRVDGRIFDFVVCCLVIGIGTIFIVYVIDGTFSISKRIYYRCCFKPSDELMAQQDIAV